jgi:hypothetical protein
LAEQVRFIDDDEWRAPFGVEQLAEGGANAGDHAWAAEGRLLAEGQQQVAVETADAQQRVGQVDDQAAVEVETGGESAHGGRFAGADLASQQADAALAHEIGETGAEFLLGGGDEQVFGGNGFGKG